MSMTPFRRIVVEGPDFSADEPVWQAHVNLGHPFETDATDPVARNHSIRLLVQSADTTEAVILDGVPRKPRSSVMFHRPLLLSAAATSVRFGNRDAAASVAIVSAAFEPVRISGGDPGERYHELHVAPRTDWPDRPFEKDREGHFQIAAPKLRATSGAMRVAYADPAQQGFPALSQRLSMDWTPLPGQQIRILGNLRMETAATADRPAGRAGTPRAIVFELVPEGVEFDAKVPNPFAVEADSWLDLRLRLATLRRANRTELRLDLVGGAEESLSALSAGLAWMMQDLSARGGNIVLQVDRRGIPPLSWPLSHDRGRKAYSCGAPGMIPEVVLREDGVGIKVLTRADAEGGAPGVAELVRYTARLVARSPNAELKLVVETVSDEPAAPAAGPLVTLTWNEPTQAPRRSGNPDIVALESFSGTASVEAIGDRLSKVWAASGAIPQGTWPPYVFLALERGWVQLPLTDAPEPDATSTRRATAGASGFAGFLRVDVPIGEGEIAAATARDGTDLPGLLVVAASRLSVIVTWAQPLAANCARTIEVKGEDCFGSLDGLLWAGEASPSPAEVLPPREAGSAALYGIPIVFGGLDVPGWAVEVGKIGAGGVDAVRFPLPVRAKSEAGPLLVWHPHPELALVSSVAMTRTAESATRPSATRELVPTQIASAGKLTLAFGRGRRLPDIAELPAGTGAHGDGRWRWPWPSAVSGAGSSSASPGEPAGVALVALTLPGIEFTLGEGATRLAPGPDLLVSLRFDLPILDELFANAKAPEATIPASRKPEAAPPAMPPTALDLRGLSDVWLENARRVACARTQADRVVLQDPGDGDSRQVRVWHRCGGVAGVQVRGLVEPYAWCPQAFAFEPSMPGQGANLGAFRLGGEGDWYCGGKALGGLTAKFSIGPGDRLMEDAAGIVQIDGFAASSFRAKPRPASGEEPDQLHDARGMSLGLDPLVVPGAISARDVSLRGALTDQRLLLATRQMPIMLSVGQNDLCFWFRDLPMTLRDGASPQNARLCFDRSGGIETARGPDAEALDRDRVAKTLYEWRFYSPKGEIGRFEIPLAGPLAARPLRLLAFETKTDGTPTLLEVLASVKLADPDPAGLQQQPVFGPDDAYGSGNLVVLRFDDRGGPFALGSVRQVEIGPSTSDPFPGTKAELTFRADADVVPVSTVPVALGLALCAKDGGIDIASASLTARLFGQACKFDLGDARFTDDAISASAEGEPGDGPVQLKRVELAWSRAGARLVLKVARLCAPLRAKGTRSPEAFARDYGAGRIRWLGLETGVAGLREQIDHDAGVVRIEIQDDIAHKELFRGFPLPAGRLRGTIAFVLKRTAFGEVAAWPRARLGSAFAEFAFDAEQATHAQRVTAIRHRHIGQSARDPEWRSSLHVDAGFGAAKVSSIGWPVGHASVAQSHFDPDPRRKADWATTLTMDPAALVDGEPAFDLVHEVEPRLCAHVLPVELLEQEQADGPIRLAAPWRLRAVVEHALTPKPGQTWPGNQSVAALEWVSIDEICVVDMHVLARAAHAEDAPATSGSAYAFQPRYRAGDPDVRIAGVVRRALANAGFPVSAMLAAIRQKHPDPEAVPPALLVTGSCVTEVATAMRQAGLHGSAPAGVTIVPQWILPWAPMAAGASGIAPLDDCPQIAPGKRSYRIAAYDAAAGTPRRLDGAAPKALAALDGTQGLIEARFAMIAGAAGRAPAAAMPADQAFLEGASGLMAPLFPRTLLALRTVAEAFGRCGDHAGFRQLIRCLVPSRDGPSRAIRFTVSAWPRDAAAAEETAPAVTLLAADDREISVETLPAPLAAALCDPARDILDAQGAGRADAALRAFSLNPTARVAMLARADDSYLTIRHKSHAVDGPSSGQPLPMDAMEPAPHVDWAFVAMPKPGLAGQPAIGLRKRTATIHASPALGWPMATRDEELAWMHARLGEEQVRRNDGRAWAGRVRGLSWPAKAWGLCARTPDDARGREEVEKAAFIALGQRVAFRRHAAKGLCAPPDRLAVPAPARARAPTVEALERALGESRLRSAAGASSGDTSRLAPFLPGRLEVTTTGQRPGVMLAHHEGILLTWQLGPFDPDFRRFGRPAARGPLIVRQLRAPRSSALPDDDELAIRRRTYVAGDERDQETGRLKLIKLIRGPAALARFDRGLDPKGSALNPHSVSLAVALPVLGSLGSDWDGRIRLIARAPGDMPARTALACIGLLPPGQSDQMSPSPLATLQLGDVTVRFDSMVWGETIDVAGKPDGTRDARQLLLDFVLAEPARHGTGYARLLAALRDASADTPILFTIRCGAPVGAKEPPPDPEAAGELGLSPDAAEAAGGDDLLAGPPHVLAFELRHVPARRRWLPMVPFTLIFGDPAYDRELGSPARSGQRSIAAARGDAVPHVLAVDRAEYDTSATIHLAFWKRERRQDAEPLPPEGQWLLDVQVQPAAGGSARPLAIAGANATALRYRISGCRPYAIAVASLRETSGGSSWSDQPAGLMPGDRLRLTLVEQNDTGGEQAISVDVGIVAEVVLPPPAASYGLATLLRGGPAVGTALFATAPLPQKFDFPDLLNDLFAGHVRRRALFQWRFVTSYDPPAAKPLGYLVKVDRSGGGQVPDAGTDFTVPD